MNPVTELFLRKKGEIEPVVRACKDAFNKLVDRGIPPGEAEALVTANFYRCNNDPSCIITIENCADNLRLKNEIDL